MAYELDYQFIVGNLSNAVIVTDESLRLCYLNPSAEQLFGISLKRVKGEKVQSLLPAAEQFVTALNRCLTNGAQFTSREMVLRLPDQDKRITVDCSITNVADNQGNFHLLVEMQQIDRMLRIAREEELLAQQTAIKVLARGLAHEVKNPLGGLRGAAQLLERELPNSDLKEYTCIIIEEADRLQKLVDHMLGPKQLQNRTQVNIHEVLEHVRQLSLVEAGDTLKIERDYDPSIPPIYIDRDQFVQVLLNLTKNARQALKDQGQIRYATRTLRQFTIGKERYRLVLKIDVTDNGPGIPPELIQQIFYPMVTGRAEGTGLGLSIAQTIVGQHGGLIECQSQPGQTVFSILIPLTLGKDKQEQKV